VFDVYIRVSRLGERTEAEATEIYETKCRAWALANDIVIDEVETDTDVSGAVAVADRGLERLLQKVEAGESEGIVTPYLDRLGRDMIESSLAYRRIEQAEGRLVCVEDGIDSERPGDKLNFSIRSALAEDYLNRTRANYQAAVDRKVSQGAHIYKAPFGYRRDDETQRLVVVEAEAKLVRELFECRANGEDAGKLMRFLRDAGVVNPRTGKPYGKSGVRGMISNRTYLGEIRVQNGRKGQPRVIKGYHPAIITEPQFDAANAVKGAFHPRDSSLASQAKLRGLVYCATCGRRVKISGSTSKAGRVANYVCTGDCEKRAGIRAARLDAYVEALVTQAAVDKDPLIAAVITGDTRYQDALAAVADAQQLHDELRDDLDAQRAMGTKDWVEALKVRKQAIELARQQLAKVRPEARKRGAKSESLEAQLAGEELTRFIDRIVLHPNPRGPRFKRPCEERVDVYLVGSPDEPYRPKFKKLSKRDAASLERHRAERAA
jgi:DNA invertase Pin-like site-specific DNA recombinase